MAVVGEEKLAKTYMEISKNKTEMPIPKNQKTNRYPADVYIENHAVKAKST